VTDRATIVYLDHSSKMSGGEIALLNLATHLDRSRFDPVVGLFADGPFRAKLEEAGVETHVIPLDPEMLSIRKDTLDGQGLMRGMLRARNLPFMWRVRSFLKQRSASIVHTNSLKADLLGGIAGRLAGVPVIWHIRDRIAEDYLPAPAVSFVRWGARHIPRFVITNSRATMNTLQLPSWREGAAIASGISLDRIGVVHDGLGDTFKSREALASNPVVGLVGRIAPWKGQHVFLDAATIVRKRFPEVRFQIVGAPLFGEHDYEQRVRRQCTELGLDDVVEFTGFREDVADLIAGFTVLVHASTVPEPFGQVVLEGMIAGKPVVATRGGGVPEIVVEGETGLLVPMGDAEAMADAIIELLGDADRARAMGEAGRRRALSEFTIERTARQVEAIYERLLGQR